ncbi:Protein BTN1 [Grifola frondosa]|uniref:Protein BTN n=1 Tax=Grifola frondosa TaxID=5627 RepID=A0A1C7MJJ9_GRIFR|nr:Protein BTN1 [Grifola frondosa]
MDCAWKNRSRRLLLKLGLSFFLFGLINNVLYVIILSAALDLVPPSTPKGIIAFCNIFPALVAKLGWPYLLKGQIHYARRLVGCCAISVSGMIVVALFDSLVMRLLGSVSPPFRLVIYSIMSRIILNSGSPFDEISPTVSCRTQRRLLRFWHGCRWPCRSISLVGTAWFRCPHWCRNVIDTSPYYPGHVFPRAPQPTAFSPSLYPSSYEDELIGAPPTVPYTPLPNTDDDDTLDAETIAVDEIPKAPVSLSARDKWHLAKPLLGKYMLPLFCVYLFEYTINQGIAPTLVYPVPPADKYWFIGLLIHSIRDYYPLWQLVYQTTVFFSRSSISIGVPPLPARLLYLPAIVQAVVLSTLLFESAVGIFGDTSEGLSFSFVFLLISIEGICGGLAYVNVFYRINQEQHNAPAGVDSERHRQEREFKIGSIGLADSTGILLASILAMPTEMELCKTQVARGSCFVRACDLPVP